jgi:hypothetical protein
MDFISEIRWRPTIGDPGFMGWFTVAAYAVGGGLAAVAGWRQVSGDRKFQGPMGRVWLAVTVLLACLCVNKQLDLQSLFTEIGRVIAYHQGWYEQRRGFQKWFVLGILAVAAVLGIWFISRFPGFWRSHKLLTVGLLFLLTFIVVRAVSFHHVDVFLNTRVFNFKMNWVLELTGIFLVGLAALRERPGGLPSP